MDSLLSAIDLHHSKGLTPTSCVFFMIAKPEWRSDLFLVFPVFTIQIAPRVLKDGNAHYSDALFTCGIRKRLHAMRLDTTSIDLLISDFFKIPSDTVAKICVQLDRPSVRRSTLRLTTALDYRAFQQGP